jgi:hypothetical protein
VCISPGSDLKQRSDKLRLPRCIFSCQPFDLPPPHHTYRFNAFESSLRRMKPLEVLRSSYLLPSMEINNMSRLSIIHPLALKAKLFLLFSSMIVIGAATVSVHKWLRANLAATTPLSTVQSTRDELEVPQAILFTIRPTGFEPAEATLPAGKYLLVVQNRSGLKEPTFRLDVDSRGRLLEVRPPKGKLDWRRQVNLTPGTYTLTEANNPEWVCRVTITP